MDKNLFPPFIKLYEKPDSSHIAVFHPYSLKVAYLKKEIWNELITSGDIPSQDLETLRVNQFIQDGSRQVENYPNLLRRLSRESASTPDVFLLKVFLTTECNFDCDYCLIEQNIRAQAGYRHAYLSKTVAQRVIEEFCEVSSQSSKQKIIFFYGGEPLLNWTTLRYMIALIREKEREGAFNGSVELILETNGSLITEQIARFLARENVSLLVSIDGPPEVHDQFRHYKCSREPTFQDALRGMNNARDQGCVAVTSAVFHRHSSSSIEEVIKYLARVVQTPSTGLDLLHVLDRSQNTEQIAAHNLEEEYIRAFVTARDEKIYVEHILRRIRPFVEENFRLRDCGACGSRIVVAPDGAYGQCEGFIHSRRFFAEAGLSLSDYLKTESFKSWQNRLHIDFEQCRSCEAVGICGGGCPYNAFMDFGTIEAVDQKTCRTSKAFIEFLVWDLYDLLDMKDRMDHVYIPSVEDKHKIIEAIPDYRELPLVRSHSRVMEVKVSGNHSPESRPL